MAHNSKSKGLSFCYERDGKVLHLGANGFEDYNKIGSVEHELAPRLDDTVSKVYFHSNEPLSILEGKTVTDVVAYALKHEIYFTESYDWLRKRNDIMILGFGGSISYGTNLDTSDIDIRGVYGNTPDELIGFYPDTLKFLDPNTDTTIYSFLHAFDMFAKCNPNVLEILGLRKEDYLVLTDIGKLLVDNVEVFFSKYAIKEFGSYSRKQINRAMNNIARHSGNNGVLVENILRSETNVIDGFNTRYKAYEKGGITLYIEDGVLMSKINMVVPVESLTDMTNELANTYREYGKLNHRNKKKTAEELAKHLMHLMRVLIEGYDVLVHHRLETFRYKEQSFLLDLRNPSSKYYTDGVPNSEFDAVLKYYSDRFDYASQITNLPDKPDLRALSDLKMRVTRMCI